LILSSCGLASRSPQQVAEKGREFYAQRKYADASLQFRKAIQKDSKLSSAYLGLGLSELKQSHFDQAFDALNHAVIFGPNDDEAKLQLADLCITAYLADRNKPAGLYEQATHLIEEMEKKHANSFSVLRLRGYLATADLKPKEAIEFFSKANELKPDEGDVAMMLVQSLRMDHQFEQAEAAASRSIERNKSYGALYDSLYSRYMESNRPAQAENILKLKIANNPKNAIFVAQLCRHYWRAGKRQEVASLLQTLTGNLHDFPQAYFQAGDFYAQAGSWEEAIRQYRGGIAEDRTQSVSYKKRIATAYLSQNRTQDAEGILDEILRADAGDAEAQASKAALLVAKGSPADVDKAIAAFESLVAKDPASREYRYRLAEAYRVKGDDESARINYLVILKENGKDIPAIYALAQLNIERQRFKEAMHYANQVLAADPTHSGAALIRSAALVSAGQYNEARAALEHLIRDYPNLREAQLQLAFLNVTQKRYSEAERMFRKNYQPEKSDFRALKGLVEIHSAQRHWDPALALLRTEQKNFPHSVEVKKLLASVSAEAGRTDLAIPYYEELAQADPNSVDIRMQLGLLYQSEAKLDPAIAEFSKAIQASPNNALAHALQGKALEQAGRKQEAALSYKRSLAVEDGNPSVMNNLAYLTTELGGDLDEALRLSRRAVEKDSNPDFKDTLGWVYLRKRDKGAALQIFQTLTKQQPGNPVFRRHLEMALNR